MKRRVTLEDLAWGILLGMAALFGSGWGSVAHGQNPELAGVYEFVPDLSDDIGEAIHEATEEAGFFVRTFGRGMLADRLEPPSVVQIVLTDTTVILAEDGAETRARLFSDTETNEASEQEEEVRTRWVGSSLVRTVTEKDGVRRYEYSVGPAGDTLTIDVTVEGSRLPQPVRYRLIYVVPRPISSRVSEVGDHVVRSGAPPEPRCESPRHGLGPPGLPVLRYAGISLAKPHLA